MTNKQLSLWDITVDTSDALWDTNQSERKYTRNWPVSMDAEMYSLLQELARHPDLPFKGNGSALARQLFAAGIDALKHFLDSGNKSMWERLREQQRLLTSERYVLQINELLDKQVDSLKLWSDAGEWSAVLDDLRRIEDMVLGFPVGYWKRYAARQWLGNKGLKDLFKVWEERMKEDAPITWSRVRETFEKMQEVSGL